MIKTKIVLLGVLHSFHNMVPAFSLQHLEKSLAKIKPDVILAELQQSEIDTNKEQKYKIEYGVILPYAKKHKILVLGMDPAEPKYSEMVAPYVKNQNEFPKRSPAEAKAQEVFQAKLFDYLLKEHWNSPAKVQSDVTNALFKVKHGFQNELMGNAEREGWEKFNSYYFDRITEAANKHPGKTILVTIGVEHVYFLKDKLKVNSNFEIADVETLLK